MLNVFLGSIFSHFPLVPTSMAVSYPTSPPNSTWWVGGGGEKSLMGGFGLSIGVAELGKRKGGGGKSAMGGKAQV